MSLYLKRNESESKSSKDLLTLKVERDLSIISSNRTNIVKKINENYDVPSIARELDVNMDILLIAIKLDKKSPVQEIKSKEFIRIGQTAYSMDQIDDIVQKRLTGKTILELARLYRNEYDALDLFLKGIQIKPIVINERDIIDFLDHFHPGSKMISYKSNSDINSAEIIIRCDKNHVFPTETNTLLNLRAWCNECYRNDVCITVEDIKAFLARNRPGSILISTDIEKNADSKVKIRCPKGHVYEKVIKKLWTSQCTECNLSFQERACKTVFDGIFSKISSSHKYFNWLINERGNKMHLDCYLEWEGQAIALEFQGKQHREFVPVFYKSFEEFENRMKDDARKARLCEENGVKLIVVPDTVSLDEMQDFIIAACKRMNVKLLERIPRLSREDIEKRTYRNFYSDQTSLFDCVE